jgi:hypothetical protein
MMDANKTDYSLINCERPYFDFIKAAHEAQDEQEQELLLTFLVEYINFVVFSGKFPFSSSKTPQISPDYPQRQKTSKLHDALNAVRYCLRDPLCQEKVWAWLYRVMIALNRDAESAFVVLVFCPIVTEPICWTDPHEMISMDRFLQCFYDPVRRWAVVNAFGECTYQEAETTIDMLNDSLKIQGRTPLNLKDLKDILKEELKGNFEEE